MAQKTPTASSLSKPFGRYKDRQRPVVISVLTKHGTDVNPAQISDSVIMHTDDYMALSQSEDDGVEKERLLSPSDHCSRDTSVEVPHRWVVSPRWIRMAVVVLLFINVSCSVVTIWQLQLASRVLKQLLGYADNRDLPRPDPYDGL